ncbi:hypothetical protein NEOC95_000633 [Neochlamydia sp. AcF95]|nr:hypothetical protein [Neochlamydia sp. AcF95]
MFSTALVQENMILISLNSITFSYMLYHLKSKHPCLHYVNL